MFTFTEEQQMLRDSADRFAKEHYGFDARRKLARRGDDGMRWSVMVALGWPLIPFSEEDGGIGGGLAELVGLYEAFGRGLVLEPYFSAITLGGGFIRHLASDERRQAIIAGLAAGERRVAAALYEPRRRFDLVGIQTTAEATGSGYRLRGAKSLVLGGTEAHDFVVLARTGASAADTEGRTLLVVPADAAGVRRHGYRLRDDHPACDLQLDGVEVGKEAVIGEVGQAHTVLDSVLSQARICLAAEALGIMDAATSTTKAYLGTRQQFGRPLGAFQVLSHRLTDMFVNTEETRSIVLRAVAAEAEDLSRIAMQAKLRANTAGLHVTKEAIQLHGGIGVTEELVIGHYYRRMITIAMLLGDTHDLRFALAA